MAWWGEKRRFSLWHASYNCTLRPRLGWICFLHCCIIHIIQPLKKPTPWGWRPKSHSRFSLSNSGRGLISILFFRKLSTTTLIKHTHERAVVVILCAPSLLSSFLRLWREKKKRPPNSPAPPSGGRGGAKNRLEEIYGGQGAQPFGTSIGVCLWLSATWDGSRKSADDKKKIIYHCCDYGNGDKTSAINRVRACVCLLSRSR